MPRDPEIEEAIINGWLPNWDNPNWYAEGDYRETGIKPDTTETIKSTKLLMKEDPNLFKDLKGVHDNYDPNKVYSPADFPEKKDFSSLVTTSPRV